MADIIKHWPGILVNLIFGVIFVEAISLLLRKKVNKPVVRRPSRKKLSPMETEFLKDDIRCRLKRRKVFLWSNDAYLVMRDAQVGPVYPWKEYVRKERDIVERRKSLGFKKRSA